MLCSAMTRPATQLDPPEFCEDDALEGSAYCTGHDPDAYDDYLVSRGEERQDAR